MPGRSRNRPRAGGRLAAPTGLAINRALAANLLDRPSPTIQAQPGPNVGPFHWENRRLRVPELKRLFTFPDDYEFVGKRISVQAQLGNCVPPLLAKQVAEQIAALNEREIALEAQFNDGEIDAPELSRAMREISSKRTELVIDQKQAEWAAKQNAEFEQQFNARVTKQFFDRPAAKLYEDEIMYSVLDRTVANLRAKDPSKGYEWALNEADRLVRQRLGGNAPSLKTVEPPPAKDVPPTVRTIGNLPAAAPAPVGDDRAEKIGMLEGEDLEKYVGRMSADDRKKLSRVA